MKLIGWAVAALALALAGAPICEAKIELSGAALVSAQDIDFDRTGDTLDEDFNFNDPRVNLYLNAEVSEKISIAIGIWAGNDAGYSHENTRGVADGGAPAAGNNSGLAESLELLNACVVIKDVAGSGFNLKAGLIDIPYGWEYAKRTNHGDDGNNDFITNGLLDINGTENGISISGGEVGHIKTPVSWEIALMNGGAVTDGNPSGAGGGVRSNDDLALALRAEAGIDENLTVQASFYTSDQGKDGDQDPLNVGSSFLVNNVSPIAGGNPNLAGLTWTNGYDRDQWELSAKYTFEQGYIIGFWGNIDADTRTAGASREWDYMGVQGRYTIDENAYLAVRWNQLDPDYATSNNLGDPSLWTVGGGYKLADNAMVKAEWSSFDEDGDGFGNPAAANTRDNRSEDADALTVSLGVKF